MAFTHLHTHSYYSYGSGASTVSALARRAYELGYRSLALTDINTLAGAVEFHAACREYGVYPIIGAELNDPETGERAVLLCQNVSGYHRLCEIISERQLNDRFCLEVALKLENRGLFVLSDSPSLIAKLHDRIGSLYGELVLCKIKARQNRELYNLCTQKRLLMVVTNDVCFTTSREFEKHRTLSAIKNLRTVYDDLPLSDPGQYLKSPDEMEKLAGQNLAEALAQSQKIAEKCQFEFDLKKYHCARYVTSGGEKADAAQLLRELSYRGLKQRYFPSYMKLFSSENLVSEPTVSKYEVFVESIETTRGDGHTSVNHHSQILRSTQSMDESVLAKRLDYELEVIINLNFADYFLICWDVVQYAHSRGIWHVGRGSAANSLVSYCLGLTEVDPMRYSLYFERFLNYSRGKPPDIDLDFSWRHRDTILRYIYDRYGHDRVAMMASIHSFHARGALREVAKANGISERELDRFRKLIPHTHAARLLELNTRYPETRALKAEDSTLKRIFEMAAQLDSYPHYSGIHSSGVVITQKPITHYSPLERSANGFVKTQYDMDSGEDIGLIKIDILAVRGLGTIEDAVRHIEQDDGTQVDVFNWNMIFGDLEAQELLSTGKTIGVVHAESPFIRNALRITKAKTFELLYIISGMVRTGCVESGMMYMFIERLLEPKKRKEALPDLMAVLPETFGVMIFEEDVIKVLHYVGNLTLEESDIVRRYMSKGKGTIEVIRKLKDKFFKTCMKKIKNLDIVTALWRQIESFSGFSFCKAHSASYAQMSFQAVYLKIHYPAHYMAAVLSNEGGFYSPAAYISECRRMGLTILPPHINKSQLDYRAEGPRAIRIGLRFIADISAEVWKKVISQREHAPFSSLQDFLQRVKVNHEDVVKMIKIGCFDFTEKKRTVLVTLLDVITHINKYRLGEELFTADLTNFEKNLGEMDDLTLAERMQIETESLGYLISRHPLEFYPAQINHPSITKAKDLHRYKGKRVKMIGWLVSSKRIKTKDKKNDDGEVVQEGQYMKFMTMEDLTGIYDTVLFPKIYAEVAAQTLSMGPFCLEGIVDERYNTVNVSRFALIHIHQNMSDMTAGILIEKHEVYARHKAKNAIESIAEPEQEDIHWQTVRAS